MNSILIIKNDYNEIICMHVDGSGRIKSVQSMTHISSLCSCANTDNNELVQSLQSQLTNSNRICGNVIESEIPRSYVSDLESFIENKCKSIS